MPLTFRRATPADADTCIPLIHSSGPAAFEQVFGRRAQDFLQQAFISGRGQFGCRQHWLAERDGRVLAVGTAYSGRDNLAYALRSAQQILSCYGPLGAPQVLARGLRMERLIPPPSRRVWYLAHLGVCAQARGQGLGQRLIAYLEELGREAGFSTFALDVSAGNPRAQALYERLGYRVQLERRSRIEGVADHRYMEKPA